jgi:hypothetical protein
MTYFAKLKAVAAVSAACAALLGAAPAQAYVYAMSHLEVQNLTIAATNGTMTPGNFQFDQTNTATLSGGAGTLQTASCGTLVGPCGPAGAVLDAGVAIAAASTVGRPQNTYSFLGTAFPGQSYSHADTLLSSAQLVTGTPTNINQIAESLLNKNGGATASTLQQSNTVLTLNFTIGAGTDLTFDFSADPDMRSEINGAIGNYLSQADVSATFTLSRSGAAGFVTWAPKGTAANDCLVAGLAGVTCVETADGLDLNTNVSAELNPDIDDHSYEAANVFGTFGIDIFGLAAGNYTLALAARTSTSIAQSVPEPGALALMGIALAGLAFTGKRRQSKQA